MKPNHLVALLLGCLTAASAARAITLVDRGESAYEILLAENALPVTVRAAEDLRTYIGKTTGAILSIRRGNAVGERPAFVIGDSPAARALGVTLKGVAPEGFRIRTVGPHLVIAGRDTDGNPETLSIFAKTPQSGTWSGVCDLLEKQLGVRWFVPGPNGDYAPHTETFSVDALDYTDAPKMTYRMLNYAVGDDLATWKRRNRAGLSRSWRGSHIWLKDFPAETYAAAHPDWFALAGGHRMKTAPHGAQMCTTSPGALDEFARVLIAKARQEPGAMLSLSPNDGGGFCECPVCRALDRKTLPNGKPVLSDRIATYANEIAERVCREIPDQTFGFYAYSYYASAPVAVRLHPNISIMNVANSISALYRSDAYVQSHRALLRGWKSKVGHILFYAHPEGYGNADLPIANCAVLKTLFATFVEIGVEGFDMNNVSGFGAYGLNNYLALRLAWTPAADPDALLRDALPACYGEPAAPWIARYFDLLDRRTRDAIRAVPALAESSAEMDLGTVNIFPAMLQIYRGLADEAAPWLEKALTLTSDPGQRYRIGLLRDNLEYTRMTDALCVRAEQIEAGKADAATIRDALALAERRLDFIRTHNDPNLFGPEKHRIIAEKAWALHVTPEYFKSALRQLADPPRVTVRRSAATAPILDGEFTDPIWSNAVTFSASLDKDTGNPAATKTSVRIARNADGLYVAVQCNEPLMTRIRDSIISPDGPVWTENEIELFIGTESDRTAFKHLLINSLGTLTDLQETGGRESDWVSGAKVAVKKFDDRWQVEVALPWSPLAGAEPAPNASWTFNLCRVRCVVKPAEYSCWSPTFGGFRNPAKFGALVFP